MENGPELILRFLKELKAIQVRCTGWEGAGCLFPGEVCVPGAPALGALLPHSPKSQERLLPWARGPQTESSFLGASEH